MRLTLAALRLVLPHGRTWEMVHHHYTGRLGIPLPNVSALLPEIRPTSCWDHMCWETLTHGGNFNVSAV